MNGLSGNSDVYPGHVSPHGPPSHGSPGSTYSGGFPFPSHGPSRNGLHLQLPPSSTSSATMRQESLGPLSPTTSSSMNSTRSLSPSSMSSSPYSRRLKAKTKLTDRDRKFICIFAERHPKVRQEDIAIKFAIERSTVSKILKARDKWMKVDMYSYGSKIMKHRYIFDHVFFWFAFRLSPPLSPSKFPEIEDPLAGWVVECAINEINLTDSLIREKAKETARSLNISEEKFKASSGWVENFKHRHSIRRGMLYIPEEIDETDETEFMTYVRKTVPDHILVRFNGGGGSTRPNAGDSGSIASGGASSTGPSEAGMHSPAMSSFSEFSTGGTSDRDRRTPSTPFYPSSLSRTSSMAPGSGGGDGDSIMPHSSPASSNGITRQTVSLGSFSPRVHPSSSSPSFGHHVGARRRNMSFDAPSPSSPLSLAFLPEAHSSPSPTQMMRSEDTTSAPGFPSLSPPLPSSPSSSHPSSSQTSDASGKEIPDASHACDAIDTILRFAQDPAMEGQMSPEERTTLASLQGRWGNVLRSRAAS